METKHNTKEVQVSPETKTLINLLKGVEELRSVYYDFLVSRYGEEQGESLMYQKDVFTACYKEIEGHLTDTIQEHLNDTRTEGKQIKI